MENKAIETIHKFPMRMKDLEGLEPDIQAALAISSMAVTECNVLMRLYLDACHTPTGDDEVDMIALIHGGVIIRALSAKLFEFWEFLKLEGKYNRTQSMSLTEIANSVRNQFSASV